ncbi:thermonuclease family protein [Roseospira navarrensis]|nr:thermonuclease family protein [Roseospira navarrensis]
MCRSNDPSRASSRGRRVGALAVLAGLAAVLLMAPAPTRADAMGSVCVESGDTLAVDGRRSYRACRGGTPVVLYGIAAPALEQTCSVDGVAWACGREAASTLLRMTLKRIVTCVGDSHDRHGRLIAVCRAGGMELNATMVRMGLAVSAGTRYAREEGAARAARAGMWMGAFERPTGWSAPD